MNRSIPSQGGVSPSLPRALRGIVLLLCVALSLSTVALARRPGGGRGGHGQGTGLKIVDVGASSISLASSPDSDSKTTYAINKDTQVTLDGKIATVDNLRVGMTAEVKPSDDSKTALLIAAMDQGGNGGRR